MADKTKTTQLVNHARLSQTAKEDGPLLALWMRRATSRLRTQMVRTEVRGYEHKNKRQTQRRLGAGGEYLTFSIRPSVMVNMVIDVGGLVL